MQLVWLGAGMLLFTVKDVRFNNNWFGNYYTGSETLVAALAESPVEKENSYKAEAAVRTIIDSNRASKTTGTIIIYFKKDSNVLLLKPGSQIAFKKPLQEIKNSGNPGSFDYKRYALYNGITHTIYLTAQDYVASSKPVIASFQSFLHTIRNYVLKTIKTYVPGKKEQGLAEALLIGYKNDLDRDLQQAYTDTGIVHVIAVSGMHLALIFWVLNILFMPLLRTKKTKWLHPVLVIAIMWLFTLIAGGAASIVRAAVMFTFIMIGKSLKRNASIYNAMAASAFLLLCYNPYWLWDVGFQLSYAAVLSIVIFYKPIYNLFFIKNKSLDWVWQLLAVSTSAQILTTPIAAYHFHQFPVYFLITNLLVVPVSSFVLIGELVLVLLSPVTKVATILGKLLSACIWWMNSFIERLSEFPFAVWSGLQINFLQMVLLLAAIAAIAYWLIEKRKSGLWIGMLALIGFLGLRAVSFYDASRQRKIIVYNIYKHTAISFIDGRNHKLITDSALQNNRRLFEMNLQPSITRHRLVSKASIKPLVIHNKAAQFFDKRILFVNSPVTLTDTSRKIKTDLVVLSGNPRLYISDLLKVVTPEKIIISGSVPSWKAGYWKKDCDSLNIPYHHVAGKGAFVMNLR